MFVDFYLKKSDDVARFMNAANSKKNDRVIILNRFDRKRKIISEKCDDEYMIEARKILDVPYDLVNVDKKNDNVMYGRFFIDGKKGKKLVFNAVYPFVLKPMH